MYTMSRVASILYKTGFKTPSFELPTAAKEETTKASPRHNWERMRRRAFEKGELPTPPKVDSRRKALLHDIGTFAAAGNRQALRDLRIRGSNSYAKTLNQYRDICVIALAAREKLKHGQ